MNAGRRFPPNAPLEGWPALDSTLIDIDGDGRPDRLRSVGCSVRWSRNSGDGFGFAGELDLPTFRVADPSDCTLAGQFTRFTNTEPPSNPIYCDQFNKGGYLAYRFLDMNGDGLPELVAAFHYDELCYDPLADPEAMSRWDMGPCEAPNPGFKRRALESCNGFPWEIYWNLGGGNFDMESPTVVHQPVPLESDTGDSSLGGGRSTRSMGIMSSGHAIIDIDGDGYLDGVRVAPDSLHHWHVFRGDGTGQFWPRPDSLPYLWARPQDAPMVKSTTSVTGPHIGGKWRGHVHGRTAFLDVNADGVLDLLWTDTELPSSETSTYLGTGTGFRTGTTGDFINRKFPLATPSVRSSRTVGTDIELQWGIRSAWRFPFDYDQDGRVDFYFKDQTEEGDPPQTETELRFGDGSGARTLPGTASPTEIARIPQVLEALASTDGRWYVQSDFLDIDGDGVSEFVELDGNNLRLHQDQRNGLPMRLLNRIENGAGGRIDIRYRPLTNRLIDIAGTDDRLGMPYHTWLVDFVLTSGLVDQAGATLYRYGRPIWNRDDRGRWGFRGFDRVQETLPRGAVVEYRHDYSLDWSGRLVERAIYDDPDPPQPGLRIDSIESTTWQRFSLFAGSIASFQIVDRKTRTCSGTQTYEQCRLGGALHVETTTWQPQTSYWDEDGPALLYAPTSVWRKRGDTIANGDRRTRTRYFVFSRSDRYRLRPLNELTDERQSGGDLLRARIEFAYDVEGKTWQMATRYNSDGTHATDYTWIELPSGQVTGRRKPEQFASTTTRSHIAYDADQVYPAQVTNELDHIVRTAHDLGTGALLSTRGPNSRPCGPSCTEWEETRSDVNGFGRPLRVFVNVENTETGRYESKLIERFTYFDAEQPQRVRHERLLDFEGDDWMVTDTSYDGFGRVRSRVEFRREPGKPDSIYTFGYDGAGRLISLTAPDPSQDNGATVVYSYEYDSLGEVRRIERPDTSAFVWARDGLRTTRTEEAASGPLAETTTERDVFGRLVQVEERLDGDVVATTTYAYDALDNVSRVTSPDGVVTDLTHDWLGRRRRITRGNRVWRYDYDLNGNVVREIAPVPAGASEAAYTSSTVYDDLDRPTSHLAGVRALSSAEQTAINHGLITNTYDEGQGGIGRLTAVTSRDSVWSRAYSYDARGNTVSATLSFDLEPALGVPIADSREQHRIFLALAPFGLENMGDGLDQATSTQVLTLPDLRGRAAAVLLPNPTRFVAYTHYNAAGVVDSIDGGNVTQLLTHDGLGRVTGMDVRSTAATPALQVSETFIYFGMDDPQTLTTFRQGLGTHQFTFDHDRRHQLTGATSDQGYEALFTYTPGGRLATAFVDSPSGAPLAPPRDVIYEYAGSDPEAVSRLLAAEGDETFIAYGHDVSGNVVDRTHAGGESFSFLYDGDDSQRRAVAADGSSEIYYYDHTNSRILTVTSLPDGTVNKVRLVFGKLEVEYAGDGSVAKTVAHLSLDRPVGRVVNRGAEQRVIHGQLGNLLAAFTPDATNLATAFVYGPFGEILAESGDSDAFIHRFNGKEQDELTDLSYYGYRYFDPYSLTWTQADPLYRFAPDLAWDQPRRMNLYAFSLNNPLRYLDPDGKNPGPSSPCSGCGSWQFYQTAARIQKQPDPVPLPRGPNLQETQLAVDTLALADQTPVTDAASAGLSLAQGDLKGFGLSVAAIILTITGVGDEGVEAIKLERSAEAAAGGIKVNAAKGKAFEDKVAAEMEAEGWTVGREVTLESGGARSRMDIVGTRGESMHCVECKSSASAPLSRGQTETHAQMEKQGATVKGKGKPNVPGGTQIPPMRVEVRRPE